MDYELALQLKKAGFPQIGHFWISSYTYGVRVGAEGEVYAPTLKELVYACGKEFHCLVHTTVGGLNSDKESWSAGTTNVVKDWHNGETPEEAVAKLYLELNKK